MGPSPAPGGGAEEQRGARAVPGGPGGEPGMGGWGCTGGWRGSGLGASGGSPEFLGQSAALEGLEGA